MADVYFEQLEEYRRISNPDNREQVNPSERFWVAHYEWLKARGYLLRRRYNPDWVPSWRGTKKSPFLSEDGIWMKRAHLIDATRLSDGKRVALKMIFKSKHPYEADINLFLSSEPVASDPKNHSIPTYEILEVPGYHDDMIMLVMPFMRRCNDPRFETIGEAVEFFRQTFEGLQFMHKHHIAHRDCSAHNMMMDASKLYPNGYHPMRTYMNHKHSGSAKHYTRTERPPRYFLIDFGLSRRYDPKDGPPLEFPIYGGDKSVPEFQGDQGYEPSNPFFTDIYYVGNMIKEDFLDDAFGFDFMSSLVADMIQDDPSKRPTIDQVVSRFDAIYRSLSKSFLRSRVVQRKEVDKPPLAWWRNSVHFFRRLRFFFLRIPPVPPLDMF